MRAILCTLICLVLGACATTLKTENSFDEDAARKMLEPGKNKITGSALIRQNGGGVVTCAGREVMLLPATKYTIERMFHLYGLSERGYNPVFGGRKIIFKPDYPQYLRTTKRTICDAQGSFAFSDLSNGDYFIATSIVWQVSTYTQEGGSLMVRVKLSGDSKTESVVLAP